MATLKLLILALACLTINALPQRRKVRTTIFGDDKLEGEAFELRDEIQDITLYNDDNPYRLPTTTKPNHYDVLWVINIDSLTFSGVVDITLVATQPNVNEIVIHVNELNITRVALLRDNTPISIEYELQPEYHFLRVRPATALTYNALNPIDYHLTVEFNADMREDMYGIYKSWFRNSVDEEERWMATTQFQATAARSAFPCYDEPSFKATFDVTIRRPQGFNSWFCTRRRDNVNDTLPGYEDDVYYRTPIMSTYLLALIVAEYATIPVTNNEGQLTYEVIARPGAINAGQGVYALEVGQDLLSTMSEHTAMDFYTMDPNLKMTQAAIPDFGAGAMENWGLLTYREAYLMYDEAHTSGYFKQLIAYILSHEIAHMWFGNLVTNEWWDVLWLNEGFARYYQYFLTHWVEDYMGLETRFITEQVHASLLSDSANNPQPLSNPGVGSPAAVSSMFSTISYNKGASVIRMTEHLLGHEVHRAGLRNYLVERAYDVALPIHLFEALQAAGVAAGALTEYGSDFSIVDYYRTWTEQPGHPVLNVQVNHQTGDMIISQRRFNINTGFSTGNTNWIVPITFATASNPDFVNTKPSHIIRETTTVINRGTVGDEWVVFNKQQTGFYRVNYDDYTWNLIVMALRSENRTQIHEYNRAQIVNDVFQFARSGLMSYTRAFNILSFLEYETEYAPWVAAITGFSWIRNRFAGSSYLAGVNGMLADWAKTVMDEITYYPSTGESFMRSYLRYQLAPVMCAIDVVECRQAATTRFRALVDNGEEVFPDDRNWVYCNALRDGTQEDFNYLWNRFLTHNVYTEKILLLQVLGCTPHAASLTTFLNAIVQDNYIIRPQDYTTAFNIAVSGNEGNTQIVFQYIQNNLQTVTQAFGSASTPLSYISSRLRTVAEIDAFEAWAIENQANLGNSYNSVLQGAQNARESLQWVTEVADDVNNYLTNGNENYVPSTSAPEVPVDIITIAPPDLEEPEVPTLPGSAVTTYLSVVLLYLAVIVNVAFAA